MSRMSSAACFAAALFGGGMALSVAPTLLQAQSPTYGVYVELARGVPGPFVGVVDTFRDHLAQSEWRLLADYPAALPDDECPYPAHVFVILNDAYTEAVLAHGPRASFALPIRVAVFEDEGGIRIAAANPQSLTRTIIAETGFEAPAAEAVESLRALVAAAFPAHASEHEYGQMRDQGLIQKTMGVVAGGPFEDKIDNVASVRLRGQNDLQDVATALYASLESVAGARKWKTRPIYLLDLSDHGVVVIGMTGTAIESKAFAIVGPGNDDARADLACPGVDHAAAFPFEILLTVDDGEVVISMVDSMFRMKLYFEDAGKMKFAANMRMPGSIENEVRDKIEESLY